MTEKYTLTFDSDMPAAAVEVGGWGDTPSQRVWMSSGDTREIEGPEEDAYVSIHFPSGRVVTVPAEKGGKLFALRDLQTSAGDEALPIDRNVSEPPREKTRQAVKRYIDQASTGEQANLPPSGAVGASPVVLLGSLGSARLTMRGGGPVFGGPGVDTFEARWDTAGIETPMVLTLQSAGGELTVQVPGSAVSVWVRMDELTTSRDDREIHVAMRVATRDEAADALTEYLCRSDMRSAAAMSDWVDSAQAMLFGKMGDPYAATVGAYLLLRLRDFEHMHNWAKNLADRFSDLPDGAVIWAWQVMLQHGEAARAEAQQYVQMAVQRGLPIYREGLDLLTQCLSMFPGIGGSLSQVVSSQLGRPVLNTPFTAGVKLTADQAAEGVRVQYDIGIASRA